MAIYRGIYVCSCGAEFELSYTKAPESEYLPVVTRCPECLQWEARPKGVK